MTGDPSLYNIAAARTPDQREYMERLSRAGKCLLCPETLFADPEQEVLWSMSTWTAMRNRFPYSGTDGHYLLVPRDHVQRMDQLKAQVRDGFWTALEWLVDSQKLDSYALGARNGEMELVGASVAHLHIHIFKPSHGVAVRMKFGTEGPSPVS